MTSSGVFTTTASDQIERVPLGVEVESVGRLDRGQAVVSRRWLIGLDHGPHLRVEMDDLHLLVVVVLAQGIPPGCVEITFE